jgi:hypothetical protein
MASPPKTETSESTPPQSHFTPVFALGNETHVADWRKNENAEERMKNGRMDPA